MLLFFLFDQIIYQMVIMGIQSAGLSLAIGICIPMIDCSVGNEHFFKIKIRVRPRFGLSGDCIKSLLA